MDKLIVSLTKPLFGHQLFLIKLLSGTQTRIHDLYIDVRLEARKFDKISRKTINLYRAAHIQHKNFAAMGIRPGLHHETARKLT